MGVNRGAPPCRMEHVSRGRFLLGVCLLFAACHAQPGPRAPGKPSPAPSRPGATKPTPLPSPTPRSSSAAQPGGEPARVSGPLVSAWSEPRTLPPGGGAAQILIRVKKPGGAVWPGVQVKLKASEGALFSNGRVLRTDARGMVRDRLTTTKTSTLTIDAGGDVQRLWVAVGDFSR
jgi:hypothetical protein